MPNPESGRSPEEMGLTPKKELEYALEELDKNEWGNLRENLFEFAKKANEVGISEEEKIQFRTMLSDIKSGLQSAKNISDEWKTSIEIAMQAAEEILK